MHAITLRVFCFNFYVIQVVPEFRTWSCKKLLESQKLDLGVVSLGFR